MRTLWTVWLAAGLNVTTFATATAEEPHERLTIEVVVVNNSHEAKVPKDVLEAAQALAARIYGRMNVHIIWKDSTVPPSSAAAHTALRLAVIIIPQSVWGHGVHAMGFALNGSSVAYVFHRRAEEFATERKIPLANILGHVLAHELGHLLLPSRRHGSGGLMRSSWDRNPELTILKATNGLAFTPEEARIVRRNARVPNP